MGESHIDTVCDVQEVYNCTGESHIDTVCNVQEVYNCTGESHIMTTNSNGLTPHIEYNIR